MKTKKKANQVKRYYSVTFDDNNETIINPKGCITNATPIILNEYEGKKGQEVMVAQYDLTKAKMNEYRVNGDTPVTQEKALTKAELLKLYEEFKEKKKEEYISQRNEYVVRKNFLNSVQRRLATRAENVGFWQSTKVVEWRKIMEVLIELMDKVPTYTEPTLNEFMESLGEKKPEFMFYEIGSTKYSYDPTTDRVILTSN